MPMIALGSADIEYETWGDGPPRIVMAHDGLGSFQQWRSFPGDLAAASGKAVLAYNRPGHGQSLPSPTGAWPANWLDEQAILLDDLLVELEIQDPLLVGHSDGASIVLIHAATYAGRARGVVALSPHSFVESVCVDAIAALRGDPDGMITALSQYHRDAAAVFGAWSGGWVSDAFRSWDIRDSLRQIALPALVAQGDKDEFATSAMLQQTVEAVRQGSEAVVTGVLLEGAGHMLIKQAPQSVIKLVCDTLATMTG